MNHVSNKESRSHGLLSEMNIYNIAVFIIPDEETDELSAFKYETENMKTKTI